MRELLRKWWFLLVPVAGLFVGGAAWAAKQESNDKVHGEAIRRVEDTVTHRLERIENKLDRLIERGR